MDEQFRDEQEPQITEYPLTPDWDDCSYKTGSTHPPKEHGAVIAAVLAGAIFLFGMSSALGVLDIRLFHPRTQHDASGPVAFSPADNAAPDSTLPDLKDSAPVDGSTIELHNSPQSVANVPTEGGLSLQEIYARNIGTVVSIACTRAGGSASGTGVIFSADGYIVTNAHVIADAVTITVTLNDGRSFQASPVGSDNLSDLAVLFMEADGLKAAEFGDSGALQVGDAVCAIGDAGGTLPGTFTDGIVSAINRNVTSQGRSMTVIQTNAALNAGNSGGPLLNCYGQVVGINTMKMSQFYGANAEGLGFAIPSATVKQIVDELMENGFVSGRPWLGVEVEPVSSFYQLYYGLPAGLYITELPANGEAAAYGLRAGDVLLKIDGVRLTSEEDLQQFLYSHQVGDVVELEFYRSGWQYAVKLPLSEAGGN